MNTSIPNEKAHLWVTKYALTQGITEMDGEICHSISSNMASGPGLFENYHGDDWHRTRESAVAKSEDMRV
jgi:hypothetical protein